MSGTSRMQSLWRRSMTRKLFLGLAALALAGCTNQMGDNGQADVIMVMILNGGAPFRSNVGSGNLPTADDVIVTLAARSKNIRFNETQYTRGIQLSRYEVRFYRSDGRNTEGVDVPYRHAGNLAGFVDIGTPEENVNLPVEVVRVQNKIEPPLRNLREGGQNQIFTCFAEITVYGTQLASGDVVKATGSMQIDFADFGAGA